jgi:hypothetical protein
MHATGAGVQYYYIKRERFDCCNASVRMQIQNGRRILLSGSGNSNVIESKIAACKSLKAACSSGPQKCSSKHCGCSSLLPAAFTLEQYRKCCLKRGHTLRVVGNGASHPFYCRGILNQVGAVLRLLHCLLRFHIIWVKTHTILGNQSFTIPHCGCKQHALAGVQLQSMLLALLEKSIESCEQVIFSLSMK